MAWLAIVQSVHDIRTAGLTDKRHNLIYTVSGENVKKVYEIFFCLFLDGKPFKRTTYGFFFSFFFIYTYIHDVCYFRLILSLGTCDRGNHRYFIPIIFISCHLYASRARWRPTATDWLVGTEFHGCTAVFCLSMRMVIMINDNLI